MNGRILELVKNPELFQIKDLELLNSEIDKHPYIQSIRALHLLGTHRLQPENYSKELSITAAYTTDKKILYQLINSVEEVKPADAITPEKTVNEPVTKLGSENKCVDLQSIPVQTPQPVFVNGELNRILFEGEENFLERESEIIDVESTIESGQIVTHKSELPIPPLQALKLTETEDSENFTEEKVIDEQTISAQEEIVENTMELSFHGTDEFLPEVKITAKIEKTENQKTAKPALNKHEEEMKRLIAEVEAKMKSSRKENKPAENQEEIPADGEVNFGETQSFNFVKTEEKEIPEEEKISTEKATNKKSTDILQQTDSTDEKKPEWKPMSFSTNTPDALLAQKEIEISTEAENTHVPETTVNKEKKIDSSKDEDQEERPVYNVSFFAQNVSALNNKEEEKILPILQEPENTQDSNVPTFINTWQNWLKIDRNQQQSTEKIEISITEIKNKVIDSFIEKEPKISKLKEESDFVIKERNDDISHLMTETLANLYTEQKLFTKAIKAYGILSEKHPEKKAHFDNKIQEIKELRQNK